MCAFMFCWTPNFENVCGLLEPVARNFCLKVVDLHHEVNMPECGGYMYKMWDMFGLGVDRERETDLSNAENRKQFEKDVPKRQIKFNTERLYLQLLLINMTALY